MAQPSVSPSGRWLAALASLGFAGLSLWLSRLYSTLHWKVLFGSGRLHECVDEASLTAAVQVLDQLWLVKALAAALGLALGFWSLARRSPRWPGLIALALASLAASFAFAIE